jgi:hypothetical protein
MSAMCDPLQENIMCSLIPIFTRPAFQAHIKKTDDRKCRSWYISNNGDVKLQRQAAVHTSENELALALSFLSRV